MNIAGGTANFCRSCRDFSQYFALRLVLLLQAFTGFALRRALPRQNRPFKLSRGAALFRNYLV